MPHSASARNVRALVLIVLCSVTLLTGRAEEASKELDAPLIVTAGRFTHDGKSSIASVASLLVAVRHRTPPAVPETPEATPPRAVSGVVTITDEQLFALFPNR